MGLRQDRLTGEADPGPFQPYDNSVLRRGDRRGRASARCWLIRDLKARGLFDETLVVFCTEFGRTPGLEQRSGGVDGRDHHPNGFTIWLAGAGVKRGHVHGATDELGYNALGDGHYVTDLHATVLHLLGLDGRKLEAPGRRRLEIDHGEPIAEILA